MQSHDNRHAAISDDQQLMKAEIAAHPLFEQLAAAHVACLRVATPLEQLPLIDAQLSHSHHLLHSYAHSTSLSKRHNQELDTLLRQYVLVLCSLREKLHQHVKVDAVEAAIRCREIEHDFNELTGATVGEGSRATMWEDDEEDKDRDETTAGVDLVGPLIPSETERGVVERLRKELKIELKQGFKSKIEQVRDEIVRKRRAGKLPDDTTAILKNWWHQHSNWPYPTEDDKANLLEETGLELKQINNWFINQRKRKWQNSNSYSPSARRSKNSNRYT